MSEYRVDPDSGCWIWQRARSHGYGQVRVNGRYVPAHRIYYEREVGPVPPGLCLDHLCRTPACVNPAHLEPVTWAENCRRGTNAKLTMEDAREIRVSSERGIDLAARFGVSKATISHIKSGRRWRENDALVFYA